MKAVRFIYMLRILFFAAIVMYSPSALAGFFDPKDERGCLEKYMPHAKNDVTANHYVIACQRLFQPIPTMVEMILSAIKGYENFPLRHAINKEAINSESLMGTVYEIFYRNISKEEFREQLDKKLLSKIEHWKKNKDWANCILKNQPLRNTKTELSARILLGTGSDGICPIN